MLFYFAPPRVKTTMVVKDDKNDVEVKIDSDINVSNNYAFREVDVYNC